MVVARTGAGRNLVGLRSAPARRVLPPNTMTVSLRALFATLIIAAVAWTTREVRSFGFLPLVDDDVNIFYNVHMGPPDASRLHWMMSDFSYVHRYMPLGWLGFSLVYSFSGLDPWGYHAADVVLHAANAVLVFLVLGQLLARFAGGAPERSRTVAAGLATLLWALHPLRVETTSWCSGLLYSQAAFFALVGVLCRFAELRARVESRGTKAALLLACGLCAFAASVLTYPVALFLPFAMAFVDRPWCGPAARARRATTLGSLAYCLVAIAGLALTVAARATAIATWLKAPTLAQFGPLDRLLQGAYVAAVYLWRTCWTGDIRWMPLTLFDAGAIGVLGWVGAAILIGATVVAWRARRTQPFLAACWVSFLILVIPNLGLSEHPHTIADRYLYFTGIVFSAALAFILARLRSGAASAVCVVLSIACAIVSVRDARNWRSTEAFQARMLRNPDPDLAHITAARAGKLRFLGGDVRGGREAVAREIKEAPMVGGVVLTWEQVAPPPGLTPALAATTLQEWPAAPFAVAHAQIARQQLAEGRAADALLHLDQALAISPSYEEARFRRGVILASFGDTDLALHDWLFVRSAGAPGKNRSAELDYLGDSIGKAFSARGDARTRALSGRLHG